MAEEQKDSAKMNDILNRCVKCKCSLAAADKTSKLLPCLHTMCDDCVSGRTDVWEKLKKLKEESSKEKEMTEKQEEKQTSEADQNKAEATPDQEKHEQEEERKKEGKCEEQTTEEQKEKQSTEEKEEEACKEITEEPEKEAKGEEQATAADDTPSEDKEKAEEAHTDGDGDGGDDGSDGSADQNTEESMEVDDTPEPVPLTECPTCREPFNTDGLIENVFVRKHMAATEDGDGGEQQCTGCELNPATSYCLQCDDWLCADCVDAHKRVRMTKDHQLTSREEAVESKAVAGGPTEVSMLCRLHPKEKLSLFCEKCEILTCRDCQLLQHQEHKYQFLQEAAESYKAKLSGSLSLMKDRRDILKRYQTEIEERLSKVRKEKGELQQEILKQADIIVKAVRAAIWSVLSSLHSFTDAAAKRLSREVGDVGDLVGKFDHCIAFMDSILEDGYGLPLLFSKSIVETKCRKVYHTHMEPQSLKGQLNIQYRHDVPALLRNLSHIGAIFVNGSKYPPEKSPSSSSSSSSQSSGSSYSRGPPNTVVGGPGGIGVGNAIPQQNIPHHVAAQERNLYMQMVMGRQPHSASTPSQGPTLSLPGAGARRVGLSARTWQNQPQVALGATQAGMIAAGMMVAPEQGARNQSLLASRAPPFSPMRLHHRPVDQMPTAPPMVLGSQLRPQPAHSMSLTSSHLPAPPPLRSPQPGQYRGAAEGGHLNAGGQAAMSGVRRGMESKDPARPASGGHTPERPLSAERNDGASAVGLRVKSEPTDSADCVITSAVIKGKKSPVLPTSLGEMQKNLDEVLKGVPLDLGDNLEPINGEATNAISQVRSPTTRSPQPRPPSSDRTPVSSPPPKSNTPTTPVTTSAPAPPSEEGEIEPVEKVKGDAESNGVEPVPGFEATGPEVKGYATGNSMPGFTLAAVDSADPNDDYCAACHQGGDVLCCDQCPRVYHLQCHVPVLTSVPSGAFVCTLCEQGLILEGADGSPAEGHGKRKAPTGLSDKDLKVCERILLELFCHSSSIPFHEPVNRAVPNYYKIITNPMDFNTIRCKLSRNHFNHYASVETFLDDVRLVFKNCAIYNAETSEVGKAGKIVREFFEKQVTEHMPAYITYATRPDASDEDGKPAETAVKKRKTTPPPPSRHHHHHHHHEKTASSDTAVH